MKTVLQKTLINTSINKNVAMLKTFLNRYVINEDYLNIKLRYYKSDGVKQLPSDNKGKPLTYLNLDLGENSYGCFRFK